MAGAQVLFYMSWESDVSLEWKLSLTGQGSAQGVVTSHAALNQLFIAQSNAGATVDTMRSDHAPGYDGQADGGSHGQSRFVDPFGQVMEQARVFGEQVLVQDLDLTMCSNSQHKMAMAGLNHPVFGKMWNEGMKVLGNRMKIDW
mmetsp:Transcript_58867/g.127996  ORF Transcript_58867/g.127996 Transcript_58867/m.127996 type:complete len:144 (+) Transcript_58867:2-433(+)